MAGIIARNQRGADRGASPVVDGRALGLGRTRLSVCRPDGKPPDLTGFRANVTENLSFMSVWDGMISSSEVIIQPLKSEIADIRSNKVVWDRSDLSLSDRQTHCRRDFVAYFGNLSVDLIKRNQRKSRSLLTRQSRHQFAPWS
jgi:hypothetical protein